MKFGCNACIYFEDCHRRVRCEHFTPATEEAEEEMTELELEESRRDFISSYLTYIEGWD